MSSDRQMDCDANETNPDANDNTKKAHPLTLTPVITCMDAAAGPGPSTSRPVGPPLICPSCADPTVRRRYTWKGVLYAIFCFPCGLWCCLRTYSRYQCSRCECDIIVTEFAEGTRLFPHGYNFKNFQSTRIASSHRNTAFSVSSQVSDQSTTSLNSETPLVRTSQPV